MIKFKLFCKREELQLVGTLNGGQSFRWKKLTKEKMDYWIGVFYERVWILEEHADHLVCEVHEKSTELKKDDEDYKKMLHKYFNLNISLEDYYQKWSKADAYFKKAAAQFYGIRILQQDTTENIFSFICSQNNHISRISSMVEKLAKFYGDKICSIDEVEYYAFPSVKSLAQEGVEEKLRENGFGYRAKYISKAAQQIVEKGGEPWFSSLQTMDYKNAKKELLNLFGIGPKVADCICLMSLNHLDAIPVDTHIYQIAARLYMPKLPKQKSISEKTYNDIGDHFRNLYGPLAGWAHTVLFCADLKKFQSQEDVCEDKPKSAKRHKK